MIPIKIKKKTLDMTVEEMRNFSFAYIEKYAPSKQQLRTYLLKKYLRSRNVNINKKNIGDLIEIVIDDLENNIFINDKYYSNSKAKNLIRKGNSINKIRKYLLSCRTIFHKVNNKFSERFLSISSKRLRIWKK